MGSTCVTEEQFNSVFNQSAAAGATAGDGQHLEAPAASSEPESESVDTASSTTPAEATSMPALMEPANDNQPIADAENEPEEQEPTAPAPDVVAEPTPISKPANDNSPPEETALPATGT